jgi:hypothetical protein
MHLLYSDGQLKVFSEPSIVALYCEEVQPCGARGAFSGLEFGLIFSNRVPRNTRLHLRRICRPVPTMFRPLYARHLSKCDNNSRQSLHMVDVTADVPNASLCTRIDPRHPSHAGVLIMKICRVSIGSIIRTARSNIPL